MDCLRTRIQIKPRSTTFNSTIVWELGLRPCYMYRNVQGLMVVFFFFPIPKKLLAMKTEKKFFSVRTFSNITLMTTVISINACWNYYVFFALFFKCYLENTLVISEKCKKLYLQLIRIKNKNEACSNLIYPSKPISNVTYF